MIKSYDNDLLDDLRSSNRKIMDEVEVKQGAQRDQLRGYATSLREPGEPLTQGPASLSNPTFKVGEAKGFTGVLESGVDASKSGHMEPDAFKSITEKLTEAASRPDITSRDADVAQAARGVSESWAQKNGTKAEPSLIRESKAQVVFATAELVEKAGLNPIAAQAVGYSFERALEKEGFKVLASQAIDKAADGIAKFTATSSSAALATGNQAKAESLLAKSVNWLADKGVGRETVQKFAKDHAGKFQVLLVAASNPETVQQLGRTIAQSDHVVDGIVAIAKDSELRKAVGTLTIASGETLSAVSKGAGSAVILAGAALKGESADEVGRHVFKMGMAIVGGAAGGIGAGSITAGAGAVPGALVGQALGGALADKILEVYDKQMGNEHSNNGSSLSKADIKESGSIVSDRLANSGEAKAVVAQLSARDR